MKKIQQYKGWLLAILLFILMPLFLPIYYINLLSLFLIMGILALSLDLIWGYTGLLSFGQSAFFGLGGYTYAIAAMNLLCEVKIKYLSHYSIINHGGTTYIPILLGIMVPLALAIFLGYLLFYGRVSGVYFAIITLSVTLIFQQIIMQLVEFRVGNIPLGGYNGITYVPSISIGIPLWFSYPLQTPSHFYYFVLFCALLSLIVSKIICKSPFGYVLAAIRDNEMRTESFGYDVRKYKLIIFMVSGALAGLSGELYSSLGNYISPWAFDFFLSAEVIMWVLIGGKKTLIGAFVGALVIQLLENILSDVLVYYWLLIIGGLFIFIVLFFPTGIVGMYYTVKRKIFGENY
jgi:urea transport system permease protein